MLKLPLYKNFAIIQKAVNAQTVLMQIKVFLSMRVLIIGLLSKRRNALKVILQMLNVKTVLLHRMLVTKLISTVNITNHIPRECATSVFHLRSFLLDKSFDMLTMFHL